MYKVDKMKFKKGDRVEVLSNGKEAEVLHYLKNSWGDELCGGSEILAVLHYINDPDPHAICFLKDDKLKIKEIK
jgi:hypothetical protein